MIAIATGFSIAPPTACSTRAATSSSALGASAHSSDATVKTLRPVTNTRLRPTRSASDPPSINRLASTTVYASIVHCSPATPVPKSRPIEGSATFTTVTSSPTISMLRLHTASTASLEEGCRFIMIMNLSESSPPSRRRALREPAQDVEPVGGRVRREEVRDGPGRPARTAEELHRPLGDPLLLHVHVHAGLGLVDVLLLQHERERRAARERFLVAREGVVEVALVVVAPDAVLEHRVPHVASSGLRARRVCADAACVDDWRVWHVPSIVSGDDHPAAQHRIRPRAALVGLALAG